MTTCFEHMCSKHVEASNKLIVKQKSLCIKLVNYWDKYTEMHGQQNVKKKKWQCMFHFDLCDLPDAMRR